MLDLSNINKKTIETIIYQKLPEYIKEHPEVKDFLEKLLKEKCADKKKTEDRFEKLLAELKAQREESEKRWKEMKEESDRKWKEMKEESDRKWKEAMDEIRKLREESDRKWKEMKEESDRKWKEAMDEIKRLREESEKRWIQVTEEIKNLHRKYDVGIGALGARWGIQAESTFREAIRGILEESFPVKVERYLAKDEEGEIFGQPDQVELDLIIRDGVVIAAEIKSSMSKSDVYTFNRKVNFYEKKEGKKVTRKLIISPMVENSAKEVAQRLGIEVYTYPDHIESL